MLIFNRKEVVQASSVASRYRFPSTHDQLCSQQKLTLKVIQIEIAQKKIMQLKSIKLQFHSVARFPFEDYFSSMLLCQRFSDVGWFASEFALCLKHERHVSVKFKLRQDCLKINTVFNDFHWRSLTVCVDTHSRMNLMKRMTLERVD